MYIDRTIGARRKDWDRVPRICSFDGMTIVLYYNDHDPPHFHVISADLETRIEILTGEYYSGDPALSRSKERAVLNWLRVGRDAILEGWNNCRDGIPPDKIPPL